MKKLRHHSPHRSYERSKGVLAQKSQTTQQAALVVCRSHTATGGPSGLKLNSVRGSLWLQFEWEMDMGNVGDRQNVGWRRFCQWAREQGVRDARNLSRIELAQFAEHLSQQAASGMRNGDARNQLISVNVGQSQ